MATVDYTASSLDGYIIDEHDCLDWLTFRDIDGDGPFNYDEFIATIGAVVMGSATYEWIVRNQPGDWRYEQPCWVLTRRQHIVEEGGRVQTFAGDVADLHPTLLSAAAGQDVWVVGGGNAAGQFVSAGPIDEMIVSYAPCSLGAGSPVLPIRSEWSLVEAAVNREFVCVRWRSA